jgi:hypothetical protein
MACELNINTISVNDGALYTGVFYPFTQNQNYTYTLTLNETVTFRINLSPIVGPPNVIMKIYKIVGNGYDLVGTSYLTQYINVIYHYGSIGDYIFCFETTSETNYELIVEFTEYDGVAFVDLNAFDGDYIEDFNFAPPPPKECKSDLFFKFLGGDLPENFKFDSAGNVYGIPIEQDCENKTKNDKPSFTWFEESENGNISIPKEYTFKARAYLKDYPWVWVDGYFKICVFNNWDYDRDAFSNQEFGQFIENKICEDVEK